MFAVRCSHDAGSNGTAAADVESHLRCSSELMLAVRCKCWQWCVRERRAAAERICRPHSAALVAACCASLCAHRVTAALHRQLDACHISQVLPQLSQQAQASICVLDAPPPNRRSLPGCSWATRGGEGRKT